MMNILRDLIGDAFVMIDSEGLIKPPQMEAHTDWHRDTNMMLNYPIATKPIRIRMGFVVT
ncbi:hypothetical protein SAMN02799624_04910 [Paenibacillus sp. UNC496MF]|nr:hypothetical protein SAMN02799624_04910 [Paenibacillus sp. UNC496MF]